MSKKPVWAVAAVLKLCGVPCAELVAQMIGKLKKTSSLYLYGTPSDSGTIGLRVGDIVTLYDGAVLADINTVLTDDIVSEYPAAVISVDEDTGVYYLSAYLDKTYKYPNVWDDGLWMTEAGYVFAEVNGQWVKVTEPLTYELKWKTKAIWSNVDVDISDNVTNDGVYLYATDPIPVSLVGYSYNGMVLHELPEWDGYAYITKHTAFNITRYFVMQTSEPYYAVSSTGEYCIGYRTGDNRYVAKDTGWELSTEYENDGVLVAVEDVLWANFDILNENGEVVLAKSAPVTIYE